MKFIYFDASSGLSGDMILGALLDLGVPHDLFRNTMAELDLSVDIQIKETKRASLRGLKVNVKIVKGPKLATRKWKDVKELIVRSPFSDQVKANSLSIFKKLFQAEAQVHGHTFSQVHLHEAGANDAIIDIVGSCFLAETLKADMFYSSPLNVGQGWVECSHGRLPVPPPAVAELLKGIPVYSASVSRELVTPTGAAIITGLTDTFIPFPEMVYEKIGYGAGSQNFPEFPNTLRVFLGRKEQFEPAKKVFIIEANIDDSTPQFLASYFDTAFKLGALDVSLTPIVMKKNRLATQLSVIAEAGKLDRIIHSIFRETSTIGLRFYPVERRVLERGLSEVKVMGETISIKTASLEGDIVNAHPEYADCQKAAKKTRLPVKTILEQAKSAHLLSQKRKRGQGHMEK